MNSYTMTLTFADGTTTTVKFQATSASAATLKAKFSRKYTKRIMKADVLQEVVYTPSPKVHTRVLAVTR